MPEPSDATSPEAIPEGRRRRREGWLILATALAVVVFAVFETRMPAYTQVGSASSDAILVALINLNLILLVLLVFLVGRNIVKLILDRRRRILGSHLRTRLVVAFVAIALLPATLLFLVAMTFVGNSVEDWFKGQVESALEGSLEVAHAYYKDLADTALGFGRRLAPQIAERGLLSPERRDDLKRFLAERRDEYQLDLLEVIAEGQALARNRRADLNGKLGADPWAEIVRSGEAGREATTVDAVGEADMVRAAVPITVDGIVKAVLIVDSYVPQSVVKRREDIDRSFGEYLRLKIQRRPIQTAYTITLLLVTLVVLFSATWVGFYVARGITVPIQRLAEGTRAVAQGDLDYRIAGEGDDEIGTLVEAFNRMTEDLKAGRTELEARRRYLEIVLANISAGVISTDRDGRIATVNAAAANLLGVSAAASVGRPLADVFSGEARTEVRQLASQLLGDTPEPAFAIALGRPGPGHDGRGGPVERQLTLTRDGHEVAVLLAGTPLVDEAWSRQGLVLFLEDVTHLMRVQRMEAWREVARRIAHEIKNPLTPIQLSAQRLRRRYAGQLGATGAVFEECTRTIIQQVEELKALVNEFATFARMPAGEHAPQDLNRIVEEALVLFREAHPEVTFRFEAGENLPEVELDREGVKRAVINIFDNAVAACAARRDLAPGEPRTIELRTSRQPGLGVVRLEIADNGVGMTPEVKARLFEPYFSTKPDGTGLGLAIVSAIVADHRGFLRVRDNVPRGSRFILEFPVGRQSAPVVAGARHGAYGA